MAFYYTYVLKSKKDNKLYYEYTKNLKLRIEQHNKGKVESTKHRRPLELIYFEGCLNRADALKREKYFTGLIGIRIACQYERYGRLSAVVGAGNIDTQLRRP